MTVEHKNRMRWNMSRLAKVMRHDEDIIHYTLLKEGILTENELHEIKLYFRHDYKSRHDYKFRHHLETTKNDKKELKEITFKQYKTLIEFNKIVKVRINHLGKIVKIGEY